MLKRRRTRGEVLVPFLAGLLLALLPAPARPARAQDTSSRTLLSVDHWLDWERPVDPQIAPDGRQIVYTRQSVNRMTDRFDNAIWIMEADGRNHRFLAPGGSPRWSPDGTRLAYLAEAAGGAVQIFVLYLAGGEPTQVTRLTEAPGAPRWSPDGRSLAFTMPVARKPSWSIDLPAAPKGATWTEAPRIIETTHYRADREGFLKEAYNHLFVVPADGGTPRALTEGNWNVGGRPTGIPQPVVFDWTPDGGEIVFDGLKEEDADKRYRESHIYAVDVKTGALRTVTSTKGPWTDPVVSHDGRSIAFTGYDWTPQTYHATNLYVIGRDGSGRRVLAGDLDRDVDDLRWAPDDSGVYCTADDHGSSNVLFVPLKGGAARRVTEGTQMLSLTSLSRDGTAVGLRSTPLEPDDVARFRLGGTPGLQVLTHLNADVLEGLHLGAVEEVVANSGGGAASGGGAGAAGGGAVKVQGWLVKPPDFDPARKYPLILHIHGGPHAMYNVAFNYSFQNLAANGYLVLYANPRGSTGYGTDFGNAIDDAYPSVDFDDLMAAVDAVVAKGSVDTGRLYVTGVSGGGVLSAWCTSHTKRFAAAAVRAPVINWISFAGTADISAWGYFRYHGRFWEDPRKWLDHSPLMHVGKVETPTLLMTGELDLRTPIGQTEEYYQALRARGIPTAMIRFNGEYHGTSSKPSNFMRTQLYLLEWFGRWPAAASAPAAGGAQPASQTGARTGS